MFATLRTALIGTTVRVDNVVRDEFAIELIEAKIKEADTNLRSAKLTLANLIQRERTEAKLLDALRTQVATMEIRAVAAMKDGKEILALEAASAIATMENEVQLRQGTVDRLQEKITRLQTTVATSHRKIIELKQGAMAAEAIHREQKAQSGLLGSTPSITAQQEAQELIERVMGREDKVEIAHLMTEIDEGLSSNGLADRMAAQGYGPSTKTTAEDVLARLKS